VVILSQRRCSTSGPVGAGMGWVTICEQVSHTGIEVTKPSSLCGDGKMSISLWAE